MVGWFGAWLGETLTPGDGQIGADMERPMGVVDAMDGMKRCESCNGWLDAAYPSATCPVCNSGRRQDGVNAELLSALVALQAAVWEYHLLDIKKRPRLCLADAQAGTAIFKARTVRP